MKTILNTKVIVTVILLLSVFKVQSQWINSITHVPANPTAADTIYFYADIDFPSGSCNEHTDIIIYSLPNVAVSSLHCLGMLTFICNHIDTFKIDPLPAGNYNFIFHVDAGGLPSPCTPGIVSGPTDSISFTVSPVTSVSSIINSNNDLIIFPNPANSTIKLKLNDEMAAAKNKSLVIYSMEGKEIRIPIAIGRKLETGNMEPEIDISGLQNGIYFCNLLTENSAGDKMKLIVIR